MPAPPLSLKSRALRWLAQREHSRDELARKLLRHLASERRQAGLRVARAAPAPGLDDPASGGPPHGTFGDPTVASEGLAEHDATSQRAEHRADDRRRVDEALDALEARGLLSDARAAQSLLDSRAARHGQRRLRQDMQAKGLALELIERTLAGVTATEFDRGLQLWQRRFGQPPQDLRERARQTRFLIARGFDADVVRRILATAARAAREAGADPGVDDAADFG